MVPVANDDLPEVPTADGGSADADELADDLAEEESDD